MRMGAVGVSLRRSKIRVTSLGLPVFLLASLFSVMADARALRPDIDRPAVAADTQRLEAHVRALAGLTEPRSYKHPAYLDSAAFYIENKLVGLGCEVERQTYKVDSMEVWNVIARIGKGRGPVVLVGAHYDVCGDQPGADDNASAVAGLLELARVLKEREALLRNEVDLAFYTLEEPPYYDTPQMGSFVHATSLKEQGALPRLMLCLDMIGYYTTRNEQSYPLRIFKLFFPKQANFIGIISNLASCGEARSLWRVVNKRTALQAQYIASPVMFQGMDWSDHRTFWKYGVRALLITDTSFLRSPYLHSRRDTPETLDFSKMAEVVRALALFLLAGVK
jgi:hypothetical protein